MQTNNFTSATLKRSWRIELARITLKRPQNFDINFLYLSIYHRILREWHKVLEFVRSLLTQKHSLSQKHSKIVISWKYFNQFEVGFEQSDADVIKTFSGNFFVHYNVFASICRKIMKILSIWTNLNFYTFQTRILSSLACQKYLIVCQNWHACNGTLYLV